MPAITRAESRRQAIANRRLPLAACSHLIGREPKALRVHQSSKSGRYQPRPRTKSGLSGEIPSTLIKISHTKRPAQSNFTNENPVDCAHGLGGAKLIADC